LQKNKQIIMRGFPEKDNPKDGLAPDAQPT
jgi:hypothetical protein